MMKTIEFLEDEHIYLCGGVIIPSVSELIRFRFPDSYKGVPEAVLKKKANYGTRVHQLIESYIKGEITLEEIEKKKIDPNIKIAVEQFERLRKEWAFHIKSMEQIVSYEGRYAGMYDLLTIDDYIVDIKTTAQLHTDWLSYQLAYYYKGAGIDKEFGYCLWLPKGKAGQVIKVDVAKDCLKVLEDYEKSNRQEADFTEA